MSARRETAFFDWIAGRYQEWSGTSLAFRERRDLFLAVARKAMQGDHPLCMDLGCGTGEISIGIAELGYQVTAVDSSQETQEMLAVAEPAARAANVARRCTFELEDLSTFLETTEESANLIVCSSVLEYLEDPLSVVPLASLRLADGGTIAISIPNPASLVRYVEKYLVRRGKAPDYCRRWACRIDTNELLRALQSEGLRIESVINFGFPYRSRRQFRLLSRLVRSRWLGTLTLVVARRPEAEVIAAGDPPHATPPRPPH
jgi:2-polyprenyl-3-methyl-5-hydroxy-6-metoxy-1,4-benzoquinol methylase